jgi:hypothetical protein
MNDKIKIDMISFSKLLSSSYQLDSQANKNLFQIFVKLFDNDVVLQNIYTLIYKIATKKKIEIFEFLPAITALVIASNKRRDLDSNDKNIIMMISRWMHTIAIMLDKEKNFDEADDEVRIIIKEALEFTI